MISENSIIKDFNKILLICFGGIGDVILFFPVIKTIRDLYPQSKITLVVEPRCKSIGESNPNVNKLITFDVKNNSFIKDYMKYIEFVKTLRQEEFDLAISMGSSFYVPILLFLSNAKNRVGYATNKLKFLYTKSVELKKDQYAAKMYFDLLSGLGIDANRLDPVPEIDIPKSEIEWAKNWFENKKLISKGESKIVILHPGVSKLSKNIKITKNWEANKWTQLVNMLLDKNVKTILAGGPDDEEDVNFIKKHIKSQNKQNFFNAYGETKNLTQFAALVSLSDLLVCVDSAPMHVGVAINSPLIAIFGPTSDTKVLPPDDEKFKAVRIRLDCAPCLWDKRKTTCEALTCIKELEVEQVFKVIMKELKIKNEIDNNLATDTEDIE